MPKFISLGVIYKFINAKPHVFMQRRDEEGPFFNFWEFPGGNIEEGETPSEAIIREIEEEVGIKVQNPYMFKIARYDYGEKSYIFYTHLFKYDEDYKLDNWFDLDDESFWSNIPPANIDLIKSLRKFFGKEMKEYKEFEKYLWK